jgi:hypothetical protein
VLERSGVVLQDSVYGAGHMSELASKDKVAGAKRKAETVDIAEVAAEVQLLGMEVSVHVHAWGFANILG